MNIDDFDGSTIISNEADLLDRIKSVRNGKYGAFMMYDIAKPYPALSIQINDDVAYLHYFPSDDHPGYQPQGMAPKSCDESVYFLQTTGLHSDGFDMPNSTLVSTDMAYTAAVEFFRSSDLPQSIFWSEL